MTAGDWRIALADALDEQAAAVRAALAELDTVHEILEERGSSKACSEIRAVAATLRSEATGIESDVTGLRATSADGAGFPMTLTTTYHPRRRER